MEVIDDIVQMFVKLIHRIDVRAENQRDKQLLADFKRVEGKTQILYRVAEMVTENPDGTIRDVIFPKVKEETFENLVAEKQASGSIYQRMHQQLMLNKYTHHYRRMLGPVLENLTFRTDNRFQPIITALAIIKRYFGASRKYFPESVPIDEMHSFVGNKANEQWIWIAIDVNSRQIVAFHVGDRSGQSAKALWQSIPKCYRQHATFYTDGWCAYEGVIPEKQHRVVNKQRRITNHIERFNGTLRQRVSRLVRKSLSFSKKLANHIGAIKYFICHYTERSGYFR
ncbi:MAG: IS1 family transposase [Nitrospinaceae bacterium]|jgi:insertion element IS1 protein InsB|nr:IS1 family transposase [Nitrospinaceae bacterium]